MGVEVPKCESGEGTYDGDGREKGGTMFREDFDLDMLMCIETEDKTVWSLLNILQYCTKTLGDSKLATENGFLGLFFLRSLSHSQRHGRYLVLRF